MSNNSTFNPEDFIVKSPAGSGATTPNAAGGTGITQADIDKFYTKEMNARAEKAKTKVSKATFPASAIRNAPAPPAQATTSTPPTAPTLSPEDKERISLAKKLNDYAKFYNGKVDYNFQRSYSRDMPLDFLRNEHSAVFMVINSSFVGEALKEVFIGLGSGIHRAAVLFNRAHMVEGAENFEATFTQAVKGGHFDPELDQLKIEYGEYFAFGPLSRLSGKVVNMFQGVASQNMKHYILMNERAKTSPNVSSSRFQAI